MRGDAELGENAYSDIIGIGIVAELKNVSSSSTCDVVVALFLLSRLVSWYEGPRTVFLLSHLSFKLGTGLGIEVKMQWRLLVPPFNLLALVPLLATSAMLRAWARRERLD